MSTPQYIKQCKDSFRLLYNTGLFAVSVNPAYQSRLHTCYKPKRSALLLRNTSQTNLFPSQNGVIGCSGSLGFFGVPQHRKIVGVATKNLPILLWSTTSFWVVLQQFSCAMVLQKIPDCLVQHKPLHGVIVIYSMVQACKVGIAPVGKKSTVPEHISFVTCKKICFFLGYLTLNGSHNVLIADKRKLSVFSIICVTLMPSTKISKDSFRVDLHEGHTLFNESIFIHGTRTLQCSTNLKIFFIQSVG